MNRKGFTLVELLATLIILAVVVGIVLISTSGGFGKGKERTEDIFVKTIEDALDIYLDSDAKNKNFSTTPICTIDKTHRKGVNIYRSTDSLTFDDVINSTYQPIAESDMHNPANKGKDNYLCNTDGTLYIYRDDDYVYYYKIDKSTFGCLNKEGVIKNLPSECNG